MMHGVLESRLAGAGGRCADIWDEFGVLILSRTVSKVQHVGDGFVMIDLTARNSIS